MDQIMKWIMNLNAKAFCLMATLAFFATAAWCGYAYMKPPVPFQHGNEKPPAPEHVPELGVLAFVSNQLAESTLVIPYDPFRPTLEAIFTNDAQRIAFINALKNAQKLAAGEGGSSGDKPDPFADLRKKNNVPDGLVNAAGQPMVIPKLSFLGFVQRPDGTKAAMFHDSVENTTFFYDAGKQQVRGVDIVNADVRQAEIRFPDGSSRSLAIGDSIELAAEPAKTPPPKPAAPAAAKAGAAKPGQPPAKPIAAAKPPAPKR
jgi:hypothetical protein